MIAPHLLNRSIKDLHILLKSHLELNLLFRGCLDITSNPFNRLVHLAFILYLPWINFLRNQIAVHMHLFWPNFEVSRRALVEGWTMGVFYNYLSIWVLNSTLSWSDPLGWRSSFSLSDRRRCWRVNKALLILEYIFSLGFSFLLAFSFRTKL